MSLHVDQVYRYARPYGSEPPIVDDLPNFFAATNTPGCRLATLEKGVNALAEVDSQFGRLCPAVLLSSSPHKVGTPATPWADEFHLSDHQVVYYGDAKGQPREPSLTPGNKAMLKVFQLHQSGEPATRRLAAPILVFRRISHAGKRKGHVVFCGVAIITEASTVLQFDPSNGRSFHNLRYTLALMDLGPENGVLDWRWISARRVPCTDGALGERYSPESWREWVKSGVLPKATTGYPIRCES